MDRPAPRDDFPAPAGPRRSGIRPRASERALAGLAVAAALLFPVSPVQALPSRAPVKTSRGDHEVLVYSPKEDRRRPLVLLLSGEGGWRRFDDLLSGFFNDAGCWVGGIDTMKYFWQAQDDRQALASDVRAYAGALAKAAGRPEDSPLILAGFSFGADLAPWIAGAGGFERRIAGLVMLGPDEVGSLEFRVMEILGFSEKDHVFRVADALASSKGIPLLFLHGGKDPDSAAPLLFRCAPEPKRLLTVPRSNHHFSGHEEEMRTLLNDGLDWLLRAGASADSPGQGESP